MYEIFDASDIKLKRRVWRRYPFGDMKVGDAFKVGGDELKRVRSASSYYGSRNGMKFSCVNTDRGYICKRVE